MSHETIAGSGRRRHPIEIDKFVPAKDIRVGRLTLLQSFECVRLVLWDEAQGRLVSFHEARRAASDRSATN